MNKYKIICTFGNFGTKPKILEWLNKENVKFEISESLGKKDEHHSGVFTEYFGVDDGESLKDVLEDYLYQNRDIVYQECFNVYDNNDKLILTEEGDE
jgi:hypothetical protein